MPNEVLIFDAASSNIDGSSPGSPLNVGQSAAIQLLEFSAPAPPQSVLYAGSVDTEGGLPATRKHENRVLSMKVLCETPASLRSLQAKIGKVASEGGTLKWILPNAEVVIFDLHAADTFDPVLDITYHALMGAFCQVQIVLPARPYGRGPEQTLADHVETALGVLVFTEASIPGDVPALGRLVIDEDGSVGQDQVIWGLQSRYYSSASTAALFFEAESCTAVTAATAVGPLGASGGGSNTMFNGGLNGTTNQQFRLTAGGTNITHVGVFNVYARVWVPATNAGTVTVHMEYTVAGSAPIIKDDVAISPVYEGVWALVNLGQVILQAPQWGTSPTVTMSMWAKSSSLNDDLYWDWLMLVPVDERCGFVSSTPGSQVSLPSLGQLQISSRDVLWKKAAMPTWSRPGKYEGDYLLVPPSGAEGRTVRFIIKATRGRVINGETPSAAFADAGTDAISARLFVIPRYLVVPGP